MRQKVENNKELILPKDLLKHDLLKKIRNGILQPGTRLPGERKLAGIYGISYMTVRRIVGELVELGILERRPRSGLFVSGTFLCARAGRPLIALITTDFAGIQARIFNLLERQARRHGFALLASSSVLDVKIEKQNLEMLLQSNVSGVIFIPIAGDCNKETVLKLIDAGIPVIMLDIAYHDKRICSAENDNFQCGYLATRHLIDKGHTNITHITVSRENFLVNPVVQERYAGFRKAKQDCGLPFTPWDLIHLPVQYTYLPLPDIQLNNLGYEEALHLLSRKKRPTAIFAAFDELALGIYHAARKLHMEIPGDLSVIGLNDAEMCLLCNPPLTSVRQPLDIMVNQAVNYLVQYLAKPQSCTPFQKKFPGALVLRQSVAAPPAAGDTTKPS